jgi:putative transposase
MPFYPPPPTPVSFQHTLHSFLQKDGLPLREVLTEDHIAQAVAADGLAFGNGPSDVWSVPLTVWAFLTQVSSAQKSCVAAVARVLTLLAILGRDPCHSGSGAYCKARAKLSESFLSRLTIDVGRRVEDAAPAAWRWRGRRVVLVDGSTLSMPDTEANQAAYPQSRTQRPGVGFPQMRWVALIGLTTGCALDAAFGPCRGKETGETALFREMLGTLRAGDVLVADRYYCSYWTVALAKGLGVDVVFRMHQKRHTDFRRGRRLGRKDHVVDWAKPVRPEWMDEETYASLPGTLTLREMRGSVGAAGSRVRELTVVTTLTEPADYGKDEITSLYGSRWNAEVDLRSIKTHMGMDVLTCKTPEMVRKEIWAHLLAYDLVREVMAQAARENGKVPRGLSFLGAVQTLEAFRSLLLAATGVDLPGLIRRILAAIATHRVGNRPNRWEPRKVKRRPKPYRRMTRPRAVERAESRTG